MIKAGYITIEDLVPKDFLKKPLSIIGEFGNGLGKTYSACQYAVSLQKLNVFDRIYIVEYSQKSCENAVRKIVDHGGWCIWHIGLEKFCPFYSKMQEYLRIGIPASYFCYVCEHFRAKSRIAYSIFEQELLSRDRSIIKPRIASYGLDTRFRVCTHPILRSFVLDPTFEKEKRLNLDQTPIFVVPCQIFVNHAIISRWYLFSRRQRKERRTLIIFDEADSIFFSALRTEIPVLEPTEIDREVLRVFSTKSRKLEKLADLYIELLELLRSIYKRKCRVDKFDIEKFERIRKKADPLIRSFDRRKKDILKYVLENKIRTNVFRIALKLEEITHIEKPDLALKTVEEIDDKFMLYDYDYGVRVLFDNEYPWRFIWKISLSATFPTDKILESEFVSTHSKALILKARKTTRTYENVYCAVATVFETDFGILNRNVEVEYSVHKILEIIKKLVKTYEERFGDTTKGICLWFGNSKQMSKFLDRLKRSRIPFRKKRSYALMYYRTIPIFISYCGSTVSRGIALQNYDISFVIGPLLRPPRPLGYLDVIDFARGVSEAIQSAMRIVRSPRPDRPKLVVLERHMTSSFYSYFYPEWFKQLFINNRIDLAETSR